MSKHSVELAAAHVAGLARMVPGAYGVSFDGSSVTFQGEADSLAGVPEALGLSREPRRDHTNGATQFRIWFGTTQSAFGTFETRVVMCSPVEFPSDCYTVEFS